MSRLRSPSYRRRAQQFGVDALLAAVAYALAFKLRFLDVPGGIPERYEDMLWGSIAFVAIGQAAVFEVLGQHQKWWRYFRLPDLWPLVRAIAVARRAHRSSSSSSSSPIPTTCRARSRSSTSCCSPCSPAAPACCAARSPSAPRGPRCKRKARSVLVVGAGSGGQMVVREMQLNPNLGSRAIGFVDDDPQKKGMRNLGLRVLGTTDEIGDDPRPDQGRRGDHRDPLRARRRCGPRSSPPRASATSRCRRCRPCSSCCAAACS